MKFDLAMIEPVGGHGGMDYYDFGLCSGLSHSGVRVILYTCDETTEPVYLTFIIRRWYQGIYGKKSILIRGIRFLLASIRVFTDVLWKRIPTVHFHFFDVGILQFGLIALAKLLRRKVVVTVHDVEGFVEGKGSLRLAKLVYEWVDRLIVHNQFSKTELIAHLLVPLQRIAVIPHGNYRHVYPNLLKRKVVREQLGWLQHEKILLFFGQIKGIKRLDLLLEAFAELVKFQPNARLVIAGKVVDVPFDVYQSQIDKLGIGHKCTSLVRYIKNEEVPLLYAAADLIVLPYERIYQSGVLLMAMSFERAVVVSDIPGMLEVVHDGETGYVFRSGDVNDLASVLSRALEEDSIREKIARDGIKLMDEYYSWVVIGRLTADLYLKVLRTDVQ
ncbi:MAG TPA: glycosyl transferase [Cellvibrio sp.]|nr:glycosyl transferase [Cellvibrio sp.]